MAKAVRKSGVKKSRRTAVKDVIQQPEPTAVITLPEPPASAEPAAPVEDKEQQPIRSLTELVKDLPLDRDFSAVVDMPGAEETE